MCNLVMINVLLSEEKQGCCPTFSFAIVHVFLSHNRSWSDTESCKATLILCLVAQFVCFTNSKKNKLPLYANDSAADEVGGLDWCQAERNSRCHDVV